jgi:hypothetical protein
MQNALRVYISNSGDMDQLPRKFNVVSKVKLRKDPKNRLGLVCGTRVQIPTSSYRSNNRGLVLTGCIVF